MPVWLTILFSFISGAGVLGGIFGWSEYYKVRAKNKAEKKIKEEDKKEAAVETVAHQCQVASFKEVISEELAPVKAQYDNVLKELSQIKEDLSQNKEGTITSLRSLMKRLRDQYMAQGYADSGDKATWRELYKNYADMGGDHFKEWVGGWKNDVETLPDHKNKE